jgi:hypothetical protein
LNELTISLQARPVKFFGKDSVVDLTGVDNVPGCKVLKEAIRKIMTDLEE